MNDETKQVALFVAMAVVVVMVSVLVWVLIAGYAGQGSPVEPAHIYNNYAYINITNITNNCCCGEDAEIVSITTFQDEQVYYSDGDTISDPTTPIVSPTPYVTEASEFPFLKWLR